MVKRYDAYSVDGPFNDGWLVKFDDYQKMRRRLIVKLLREWAQVRDADCEYWYEAGFDKESSRCRRVELWCARVADRIEAMG